MPSDCSIRKHLYITDECFPRYRSDTTLIPDKRRMIRRHYPRLTFTVEAVPFATYARDTRLPQQHERCCVAERKDDMWIDSFDLVLQIRKTRLLLTLRRRPVARRTAFHCVCHEYFLPSARRDKRCDEGLIEQDTSTPDEWTPSSVLVTPRRFADYHRVVVRRAA